MDIAGSQHPGNHGEAEAADLDAARGLVPAVLAGATFWAFVAAIASYFWS